MTKEDVLTELERQIGGLDENTKRAVNLALDLAEGSTVQKAEGSTVQKVEPKPSQQPLEWEGENPSFEEMARLDMDERSRVMQQLEERNYEWLERKRNELGAFWMIVIDGKVIMHGPTLDTYPTEEFLKLGRKTGKLPLDFMGAIIIEESTPWYPTAYQDDFYPTVAVSFQHADRRVDIIADFDTGAMNTCVDADLLEGRGVIQFRPVERWRVNRHLGLQFEFVTKPLEVVLIAADGTPKQITHRIICVRNWYQSSFVAINPNRTTLLGRDICLRLQPKITLDFAQHQTTLQW